MIDPIEMQIVYAILADLNGRSGFDHWWDGIDVDTQDEIVETLAGVVRDLLEGKE